MPARPLPLRRGQCPHRPPCPDRPGPSAMPFYGISPKKKRPYRPVKISPSPLPPPLPLPSIPAKTFTSPRISNFRTTIVPKPDLFPAIPLNCTRLHVQTNSKPRFSGSKPSKIRSNHPQNGPKPNFQFSYNLDFPRFPPCPSKLTRSKSSQYRKTRPFPSRNGLVLLSGFFPYAMPVRSKLSRRLPAASHTPAKHFSSKGLSSPAFLSSSVNTRLPPCLA